MVTVGIDWGQEKHAVCVLNAAGATMARFTIPHTSSGLADFEARLTKLGLPPAECWVALETAHHLLMDFLWARAYTVYVIPPSQAAHCRDRYSSSGAYTDDSAAWLLADLLRTDRPRFSPWQPDGTLVRQMRAQLSLVDSLTGSIIRYSNRLTAVLLRYYPQALEVFGAQSQIHFHFLRTYPTPQAAQGLTYADFEAFCLQHHYRRGLIPEVYANLRHPALEPDPVVVLAYQSETVFLAGLLLGLVQHKEHLIKQVNGLFDQHPDQPVFASLPGVGELLAPKLLVILGDHRERFPSPNNVRDLVGTCPVTRQSGKRKTVHFRRACNHDDRNTFQQFAIASVPQSEWAAAYFADCRARSMSKNHAYRCLANRWVGIIWQLWQTHALYDEAYHLQQIKHHRRVR
jgi:transposase